jgi:hypothetical protein
MLSAFLGRVQYALVNQQWGTLINTSRETNCISFKIIVSIAINRLRSNVIIWFASLLLISQYPAAALALLGEQPKLDECPAVSVNSGL